MHLSTNWSVILSHWSAGALISALLLECGYLLFVVGPYRQRLFQGAPVTLATATYFLLAMVAYALAFGSPLDYISDNYLFSAHMIQHMLEVSVMAPLVILGLPAWLVTWALRFKPLRWVVLTGTKAPVALIGFSVVLGVFHFPVFYNITLTNETFHVFEHVMFFFWAMLLWWPVLSKNPEIPRLTPGQTLGYLFFAFDGGMPPSLLILFWNNPLYLPYGRAPRLFGLSLLSDQRLGAVIMLGFMVVSYGIAALAAFARYDMSSWYE